MQFSNRTLLSFFKKITGQASQSILPLHAGRLSSNQAENHKLSIEYNRCSAQPRHKVMRLNKSVFGGGIFFINYLHLVFHNLFVTY